MTYRTGRPLSLVSFVAAVLLIASCGGSASTTTIAEQPAASSTTAQQTATPTTTAQTQQPTEASEDTPQDIPECEGPIDEIALGATVSSEVVEGDPLYFCVDIPTGVDSFTVSLTGLTASLALYVGYPDLETVQQGGVGLKSSTAPDTEDKEVTVDIDPDLIWSPGSYYIEVSASAFASSTFSLTVSTP